MSFTGQGLSHRARVDNCAISAGRCKEARNSIRLAGPTSRIAQPLNGHRQPDPLRVSGRATRPLDRRGTTASEMKGTHAGSNSAVRAETAQAMC